MYPHAGMTFCSLPSKNDIFSFKIGELALRLPTYQTIVDPKFKTVTQMEACHKKGAGDE